MRDLTNERRRGRGAALFAGAAAMLVLVLSACTGSSPSPAGGSSAGASGGAGGSTVTLQNTAFSPATLTVAKGTTVTFTNKDSFGHTATNGVNGKKDPNGIFDIDLPAGQSGTFTFDKTGTYNVTCLIHGSMHMTIVVQ